ncbi:TIGR03013 family XrtA/PEP-CTERM system glycosyltransferase [Zooshikella harenae]|uniref:TIGR03013 family PEP-CTERM/XrtA system glycosyltransferase n=1 Tax=Zooshikella harenae TaxID=2827238 RepID=A0ABS5Z7B3_9GAMM|nr:TIGR03013 family XrtA/PEP-CTERM system glycosyltransferase [Zooshikella harenae]MBU2709939.1 TIGR03013 family PEP-CTERM/XrtA system glycosyltransferase [Zooshikella harenae]
MSSIRIFKHHVRVPYLLLGIFELCLFVLATYLGTYFRFGTFDPIHTEPTSPLLFRAILLGAVFIISMIAMGLYQARLREGFTGMLIRAAISFIFGSIILSLCFFLFPTLLIGRGVFILTVLFTFVAIGVTRFFFTRLVDENILKRQVLVLGAGHRANNIAQRLRRRTDRRGFNIVGYMHIADEEDVVNPDFILNTEQSLVEFANTHNIDEIVVAVDDRRRNFPINELLDCKLSGIDVVDVLTFFERETGKIELDLLHPSWIIFSDGFGQSNLRVYSERAFDILASLTLLAFAWPFIAITILAIWLEEGFKVPLMYKQKRVGLNGNTFNVLKFRSMRVDAEKKGKPQWAQQNDPRVTRVGKIIRKYRVDELPQIFNVLRGDMGFVGPRPERPEFVSQLTDKIPYYNERHRIKPGIAGWAQLCYPYGASDKDALHKLQYDLYYVKNHSLFLDILILIQTVEVILFGKGAR